MTLDSIQQVDMFRKLCAKSDAKRDKGLSTPDDIQRFDDISYGTDPKYNLLDIYRPENNNEKLPVILSFHGGGWVYGTKDTYQFYCMSLAQKGFAVVNPSYRLAPENRFPAAFEDINTVCKFIIDNADKYGFDTQKICAVGDSAGATGLAVYSTVMTNEDLAKRFPVKIPDRLVFRAIGLNCGVYQIDEKLFANLLPDESAEKYMPLVNISDNITSRFPPCYIFTSNGDFLKEEPDKIIPILEEKGIRYKNAFYGDENNLLGHVFHCDIKNSVAQQANTEELEFFRQFI